jgi:L-ascorbate metabolism protein UlaG (beta-lactamase superfamily)
MFRNLRSSFVAPRFRDLLRWQLGLHPERWPRAPRSGVPVPFVANDGSGVRGATRDTLTWIGHASFLLQLGGRSLLIDPVLCRALSGVVRRNVPPGLDWPALPPIDAVLITHNHRDHMDVPTLKRLGPEPRYFVPRGLGDWFHRHGFSRAVEMDWWREEHVGGVRVTFVPAQHWSRRHLTDTNTSWWGGYVIEHDGVRVYHSGDTAWFEGFEQIRERCGSPAIAILPAGAYAPRWFMRQQHVDPDDAVRAFETLGARRFVAMHWGTFKLSDEALADPPALLRDAWRSRGLDESRLLVPAIGETITPLVV